MAAEIRELLKGSQRVVIKAGTSVVSTPEGYPSLVRLANIVEQVSHKICENGFTTDVRAFVFSSFYFGKDSVTGTFVFQVMSRGGCGSSTSFFRLQ